MSGDNNISETSPLDSDSIVGTARLLIHLKQNNIQYLLGVLIAYQMGLLDKLYSFGIGVCN